MPIRCKNNFKQLSRYFQCQEGGGGGTDRMTFANQSYSETYLYKHNTLSMTECDSRHFSDKTLHLHQMDLLSAGLSSDMASVGQTVNGPICNKVECGCHCSFLSSKIRLYRQWMLCQSDENTLTNIFPPVILFPKSPKLTNQHQSDSINPIQMGKALMSMLSSMHWNFVSMNLLKSLISQSFERIQECRHFRYRSDLVNNVE